MKKILGLDLGTNSIGWAVVNEAQTPDEKSSIIKLGVRVNPLTVDEISNFEKGKSITTNADRTLKRSARRNLQRYKLRREQLIKLLIANNIVDNEDVLSENGNKTTFETCRFRAKAATEEISLVEFARVLLMINKKRGYKSSRKAKSTEDGQLIDGMEITKKLYDENLTPGQYTYQILKSGKNYVPDFYRSDLQNELDSVWIFQKQFYENELSEELKESIVGRNKSQTWAILAKPFNINGIKRNVKGFELKLENYKWRNDALSAKLGLEELAIVLQEINGQINNSSGYLGTISDRSKTLFFNKQTVGQYQMAELDKNPHYSFKNQVFYRQDYLNEFETIWETQSKFHSELTPQLKNEVRNVVIFYQRPLKSQKGLISLCEFERKQIEVEVDGKKKVKTIGFRVCPKSSPLFQEFKIWQILNNLEVSDKDRNKRFLDLEEKQLLFKELQYKDKLSKSDALKLLYKNYKDLDLNYSTIDGNRTQATLTKAYQDIIVQSGNGEYDFSKMSANQIEKIIVDVFNAIGINTDILKFDSCLEGVDFEMQPMYQLWHLLYSYEGDNSNTGNAKLIEILKTKFGFDNEYANILAKVAFQSDYGSLSTKAMRKILPYMKEGLEYSVACEYAGYRHSQKSLTKEELENKVLKDKLDLLPRNSLRNPVVEKILNQMVNVVNGIVDTYGKPDEIRIELARELKKSAKERVEMTKQVNAIGKLHEEYKQILVNEFGIPNPTRNDIIRYKLYLELKDNGFKTLYTGTYISQEKLFSKEFDIEHIIPQSKAFDDSFGNKTLEARQANIEKGNMTAYDYVTSKGEQILSDYKANIERLRKIKAISEVKAKNLLITEKDIPNGFINRDLRDSQYIAKKAKEMLEDIVKYVVSTTGTITDRLREDWQLVDVMKELNWDKYAKLGLTHYETDRDGRTIAKIDDWTKRNDHRHHAMDALTIAFTKRSIIQYLNNLNARVQKGIEEYVDLDIVNLSDLPKEQRSSVMYAIEQKELYRDKGKLRFVSPIPLDEFRREAKKHLENVLVSIKAKNKVVTKNINVSKTKNGKNKKVQLTPRGQLHLETVFGSHKEYVVTEERVGATFGYEKIALVADKRFKDALLSRLNEFNGDAKKAFTGKNSLIKNPIYLNESHTAQVPEKVKLVRFETVYTIRKAISSDLKIEKVVDPHIREILRDRLDLYDGDAKKAFSNLEENPIWLNKEKGIQIKAVTIYGINNAIALHNKTNKDGEIILDADGNTIPVDFVNTGNNHHVAIYMDSDGNLQENIVSFYEAVERANQGLPIIDKSYNSGIGWKFLFTMKQNEYFVFPNLETGFDPNEIDLMNPDNYSLISPNLFRVQKLTTKDYFFRHHLETSVLEDNNLKNTTWKRCGLTGIVGIVKVRINHIGQIVSVGEY